MLRLRERMGTWLFMATLGVATPAALGACGDDDDPARGAGAAPSGNCESTAVRSCTSGATCVEIFDTALDPILTACTDREDAVVNDAPCPREGADGACSSSQGATCNNLYTYDDSDPITPEFCTTLGGTYFDP